MKEYYTETALRTIASNAGLITTLLEHTLRAADPRSSDLQRMAVAATIPDSMELHFDRLANLYETFKTLSNRVTDNVKVMAP